MTKIMVVDDEYFIVKVVGDLLRNNGYEVIEAFSGFECLEKLKTECPDLIILDIMMPEMDGWETLDKIKKIEKFESTPVIMLTVVELTPETIKKRPVHHLVDYIQKPYSVRKLIPKIKVALRINEEMREIREKVKDKKLAKQYEFSLRVKTLHENLIQTLKENSKRKIETGALEEAEKIYETIAEEKKVIKKLKEEGGKWVK